MIQWYKRQRQRQEDYSKFKASLVYTTSSKLAWYMEPEKETKQLFLSTSLDALEILHLAVSHLLLVFSEGSLLGPSPLTHVHTLPLSTMYGH